MQNPTTDNDAPFAPDWISPPGDTILGLIEYQGWSRPEFASRIGLDDAHVDALIEGSLALDETLANRFAETFGSSIEFWLRREATYRASRSA
jgi:HTH-type transcriptional regulator/antitoxin HigA